MRKRLLFTVLIVSLLFFGFGLLSCRGEGPGYNGMERGIPGSVGSKARDFTLQDLDGRLFSLSDAGGKVVILDFWATWCPPCRMELPHFQSLYAEYREKGLMVIGIALDRGGSAAIKAFVEKTGITYPVLIGNQKVTIDYGGIRNIPTTFVMDREGRIVEKFTGYRDKKVFEDSIRKLL